MRCHLVSLGSRVKHTKGCNITGFQVQSLLQLLAGGSLLKLLYMHHSLLTQGADKTFVFLIGHQEGELFHLLYHAVASFLFSCKALSIF